ncbi:hypothetical protein BLOT_013412 [Blomia tropicalis]|nr:hypothetical protein BLOT_013412 [Blomia tropicalis]
MYRRVMQVNYMHHTIDPFWWLDISDPGFRFLNGMQSSCGDWHPMGRQFILLPIETLHAD